MVKEKKILLSDTEWLNDNIMNTVQKLICKALGDELAKEGNPFF